MRVGLNLIYLVPGETGGMETYARELLPALLRESPDLRLTAFVNRDAAATRAGPWCELVPAITVPVSARQRWQWVRGEQQLLPRLAARAGIDVLHSLGSTAPAWGSFRRVATIHDLIYRIYPEAHSRLRARAMSILVPLAARRSDRIIVPSNRTKSDVVEMLGLSAAKVDVVPLGLGMLPGTTSVEDGVRARLELGDREVVLTTSAKRPHKNLGRLLEALALISPDRRPLLVLPGYPTEHERELRELADRLMLTRDTRFVGWVSEGELEGLYREAICFVFPSLYEGFGLPVLEAMARGVPVACSDRGALGEVAGDAALIFNPTSPESIAHSIETLLADAAERSRLRLLGFERASHFSWEETARGTLASYERALSSA